MFTFSDPTAIHGQEAEDPSAPALVEKTKLSDDEIAAIAGDAPGLDPDQRDSFGVKIAEALALPAVSRNGVPASLVDVSYGKEPRQVFDLWRASDENPTPLVIFLHGGGFWRGDKAMLYESRLLDAFLEAGISVAGVNYRFSHQLPDSTLGSLRDAARFVQFIRLHAAAFGVDQERIASFGGSAGGAASLWLAFHEDLADPESEDPVSRQSSRILCAGAMATPSTLDMLRWEEILDVPRDRIIAVAAHFGIQDEAEFYTGKAKQVRAETDLLTMMSAGDAPFFVHNNDPGDPPRTAAKMAHHPLHARALKRRARALGLEAVVFAPGIGLEDPSGETLPTFFARHFFGTAADAPKSR